MGRRSASSRRSNRGSPDETGYGHLDPEYELCFGSNDNLKVSQIWDSQEQLEAFGERLRPVLAELGINPGEPEVLEVHNIIKR